MAVLGRQHRYAAILSVIAAAILVGGFLLKPAPSAEHSRQPEATVMQAELDRLRELAQRNSLRNLSERFNSAASDAATHLLYASTEHRTAIVWGPDTVLMARGLARLPSQVALESKGTVVQGVPLTWPAGLPFALLRASTSVQRPTIVSASSITLGAWVLLVTRASNGEFLFTPGTYSGSRPVHCGDFSFPEVQTSIALTPATEGAAIFDMDGNLVAVVGQCEDGLTAVPAKVLQGFLARLQASPTPAFLDFGMQLAEPNDGWGSFCPASKGVIVTEIWDRWPAASSGLEPGDCIVAVDGEPVQALTDVERLIGLHDAKIQLRRNQRLLTLVLNGPPNGTGASGVVVATAAQGITITRVPPGSSADKAGLLDGDHVLRVNGRPATENSVEHALAPFQASSPTFLIVQRGERRIALLVQP